MESEGKDVRREETPADSGAKKNDGNCEISKRELPLFTPPVAKGKSAHQGETL